MYSNRINRSKTRTLIIGLVFGVALVLGNFTMAGAAAPVTVELNGQNLNYTLVAPQIINDRVMVPIRETGNFLGMTSEWNEATQTMTFTKGSYLVTHILNQNYLMVNGTLKTFDTTSQILNNYTMMPVRMLAEAIGATVSWDAATQKVSIFTNESPISSVTSAEVIQVKVDDDTVSLNNAVAVTVTTNAFTARVFVKDQSGTTVASAYTYNTVGSNREWILSMSPAIQGNNTFTVHAYNGQGQEDIDSFVLRVEQSAKVTINEVDLDSTDVSSGERVTAEIYTSNNVTLVWVEDADGDILDETDDYDREGNERYWELTFRPTETGTYYFYAEDDDGNDDNDSIKIYVDENDEVEITDVDYNINDIYEGDIIYIDVYTNNSATYVWVEDADGTNLNGIRSYEKAGSERYWELEISPSESGKIYIYAEDNDGNEDSYSFNVYVESR